MCNSSEHQKTTTALALYSERMHRLAQSRSPLEARAVSAYNISLLLATAMSAKVRMHSNKDCDSYSHGFGT